MSFCIGRTLCVSFCVCHGWLGARVIPAAGWIHAWALPLRPRARSGHGSQAPARCGRRLSKIEQLDSVCSRTHGGFGSKGLENLLYLFNIQMTRSTPRRSALTTIQSDHIQTKKMKCLKAIAISWSLPGINNVSEILPESTQ